MDFFLFLVLHNVERRNYDVREFESNNSLTIFHLFITLAVDRIGIQNKKIFGNNGLYAFMSSPVNARI